MIKHSKEKSSVQQTRITGVKLGKYSSVLLMFVFVVWLTVFKSGSIKPFEEVAQAVQEVIPEEELIKKDSQALKNDYGLNSAEYEGILYYTSDFTMSAEEVLLIKVKHDSQVDEVKSAIEKRLETRIDSFEGYAPEQVQLLEEAAYVVRGTYIFMAVSPDAEIYREAFEKSL